MARRAHVPAALAHGPFHVRDGREHGLSQRQLDGGTWHRLLPAVWVHRDVVMTEALWWTAARKFAPPDARFTGATRLQQLGLDLGPHRPLQMVVARDLHRAHGEVFIHRTDVMPPHDDEGVSAEAVFIEICRAFSVLDAAAAGDWLLAQGHLNRSRLVALCRQQPWRAGAPEALWMLPLLDPAARSVPESQVRVYLQVAGLPRPEINVEVDVAGRRLLPDWWWRHLRAAAEYEGGHHQTDRAQYVADIDRYRLYRRAEVVYCQITAELRRSPRTMVRRVHEMLVEAGYDGPAPAIDGLFDLVIEVPAVAMAFHAAPVRWRIPAPHVNPAPPSSPRR